MFEELRLMSKKVTNPKAQWVDRPKNRIGHQQRNFQAVAVDIVEINFGVYMRRNLVIEEDFSCGIEYRPFAGSPLMLARYNGPGHWHRDADKVIAHRPHIHKASEMAISLGKKPDWFADETDRFETLEGALACLIEDYSLTGIANSMNDNLRLDL